MECFISFNILPLISSYNVFFSIHNCTKVAEWSDQFAYFQLLLYLIEFLFLCNSCIWFHFHLLLILIAMKYFSVFQRYLSLSVWFGQWLIYRRHMLNTLLKVLRCYLSDVTCQILPVRCYLSDVTCLDVTCQMLPVRTSCFKMSSMTARNRDADSGSPCFTPFNISKFSV